MKTKQFKTNINCMGCVTKITPILNEVIGENQWEVNIRHKDKILTVPTTNLNTEKLVNDLKSSGFKVESLN
ncbi:heavy-metal-associated domain-containing protein [Flavobacterium sedimenticola]|uniref:Heavy-metal-associated domain-containing protein n=1 Tax=Flavobacterium sedimenticola TaxID=3043286 RepID=A0ABT6XSV6_9FLAO|nr:heavy-metal-associated domain-containing protein [Flavobacterium sedimenticola]MDI9258170.1 heavy-metal-associated domain-containing protein [Flavobacterium sedimenticola]